MTANIQIHSRHLHGDGYDYYTDYCFKKLKIDDYYWVMYTGNNFKVLLKIGNYTIGIKQCE